MSFPFWAGNQYFAFKVLGITEIFYFFVSKQHQMKYLLFKLFFFFLVSCIHCFQLSAQQQLVLELVNGTVENYPVSEIRSIKFGSASMNIRNISGTSQTRNINNILKYRFQDISAGTTDKLAGNQQFVLYPNPAREWLEIEYASAIPDKAKVEILSLTGLSLETIFEGFHSGKISLHHSLKGLPAGMYLCRLSGESGLLVKPFFVQ